MPTKVVPVILGVVNHVPTTDFGDAIEALSAGWLDDLRPPDRLVPVQALPEDYPDSNRVAFAHELFAPL